MKSWASLLVNLEFGLVGDLMTKLGLLCSLCVYLKSVMTKVSLLLKQFPLKCVRLLLFSLDLWMVMDENMKMFFSQWAEAQKL